MGALLEDKDVSKTWIAFVLDGLNMASHGFMIIMVLMDYWGTQDCRASDRRDPLLVTSVHPPAFVDWSGFSCGGAALVAPSNRAKYGVSLLIDKASEQLLCIPEYDRPCNYLCGRV